MLSDDERVQVRLVRTGGFAGVRTERTLDSDALDPAAAGELRKLALAALAALAATASGEPGGPIGADRFHYDLTVSGPEGDHRFSGDETTLAPAVRALARYTLRPENRSL